MLWNSRSWYWESALGRSCLQIRLIAAMLVLASAMPSVAQHTSESDPIPLEPLVEWPLDDAGVDGRADVEPIGEARLDDLLATYAANEDLQTERPVTEPEPLPEHRPRSRSPFFAAIGDFFAGLFRFIGSIAGYLIAVVIAGVILYGLYLMYGEGLSLRRKQRQAEDAPDVSEIPDYRPNAEAASALLGDADELAAQGRYAEAVHLLLFRSIDDIRKRRQGGVPKSLTAREIGGLAGLPGAVRSALSPIISIVERSFFGGHPVDAEGWAHARSSYEAFAFGEAWA